MICIEIRSRFWLRLFVDSSFLAECAGADTSLWDVVPRLSQPPSVVCLFNAELTLFPKPPGVFLIGRWVNGGGGYGVLCSPWQYFVLSDGPRPHVVLSITGDQVTVWGFLVTVTEPDSGQWQEAESSSSYWNLGPFFFFSLFLYTSIWATVVSACLRKFLLLLLTH